MSSDTDNISEDISHLVLDSGEKVTVQKLANLHLKSVKECTAVLDNWVKKNKKTRKDLLVEYMARGELKNGIVFVSVLSEQKLLSLEKKANKLYKSVYSVEVKSNSRSLEIPVYEENQVYNLKASTTTKRENKLCAAPPKREIPTSSTTANKTSNSSSKTIKPVEKQEPEKKVQKKLPTNTISSMFTKNASPKKPTAKKEESSEQVTNNGNKAPPKPAPKNSIAAFFSGKATASKPAEPKSDKKSPIFEKATKTEEAKKSVEQQARKRTICDDESSGDDVIPATPTPPVKAPVKKSKIKTKAKSKQSTIQATKRSRIMTVESSSDSEDAESLEERLANKGRSVTANESPVKNGKRAIELEDDDVEIKKVSEDVENYPKNKAKRYVVKSYKDEEGFLVTRKELEEYSADEEEKPAAKVVLKPKEKIDIANANKKRTKQGSIMNFFTKKN